MTFLDYFPSPTRILHEIQKELIEQTNKENSNIWREKHQILHTLDQQHHHPPQQQIAKPENSNFWREKPAAGGELTGLMTQLSTTKPAPAAVVDTPVKVAPPRPPRMKKTPPPPPMLQTTTTTTATNTNTKNNLPVTQQLPVKKPATSTSSTSNNSNFHCKMKHHHQHGHHTPVGKGDALKI